MFEQICFVPGKRPGLVDAEVVADNQTFRVTSDKAEADFFASPSVLWQFVLFANENWPERPPPSSSAYFPLVRELLEKFRELH